MWIVRELVRLVMRIVVITAVTLAVAALLALVSAGSFDTNARILCIVVGCMLLAMAGVGRGSNVERFMDTSVQQVAWGNIPGFDAVRPRPEDPTLAPGAAFFCSGLALIVIGIALF
jgi:hypothetical protein